MNETELSLYNAILAIAGKITTGTMFLPVVLAIGFWKRLNKPMRLMLFFFITLLLAEFLELGFVWAVNNYTSFFVPYLTKFKITDTNFLSIFHRLPDYMFVGWIFSFIYHPKVSMFFKNGSWILGLITILIYFVIDGYNKFGIVNPILNRAFLILLPLYYFWFLSKSPPNISLWRNPFFLFALGLFIPNLFSFLMSLYGNKLNETDFPTFVKLSIFRNFFTIVAQFLFALAFYHARLAKFLVYKRP